MPDAINLNEDVKEIRAKKDKAKAMLHQRGVSSRENVHLKKSKKDGFKVTNQNAREWVEGHLFSDVRIAMKELIEYI